MRQQALILSILFLAAASVATAQKFIEGYYVKISGDTVKTDVFLRKKNGHILGLLSKDGQLFGVRDLKAAGVGKANYVVKAVEIDKSPKAKTEYDTMFLEILSREKISLLYSVDENDKSHFFIEDEVGTMIELVLHILDQGDGVTFQELPVYKATLKAMFANCKDLTADIDKTHYSKNSIRSIFGKLYECTYGTPPGIQATKSVVNDFGLTAGVSSTSLKFENPSGGTAFAPRLMFDKSNDITGGIFMESKFPRMGKAFSLRNEITHRKYDASSDDYYNGVGQTSLFGSVKASYVKYSISGRMAISQHELKPFAAVGLSPAWLLSSGSKALVIVNGATHSEQLLGKVKSFEFGYFFGAGLMYNSFTFEARVEQSTGLNPETCKSKVNTVYVMLSYRLWEGDY